MPPSNTPTPSSSISPTPPVQPTIRAFFQSAMDITPQSSSGLPPPSLPSLPTHQISTDEEDEDEDEDMDMSESRKRRHQSSSPEDPPRPPGDGSLLTNTSINPAVRRTRLSTNISSPEITSTPDQIDIQLTAIRGAAAAAIPDLPNIPDEETVSTRPPADHSSSSNLARVNDMVAGVVQIARETVPTIPSEQSMTWDNQDLSLSNNRQMSSPLPLPNIPASPPPSATHPPPTLPTNGQDISEMLSKTFKEHLATAYQSFETNMLASIAKISARVDANSTMILSTNARVTILEHDMETAADTRQELQVRVRDNAGHIERIDQGSATQQSIFSALVTRVNELENALQASQASNPPTSDLTTEEVIRFRQRQQAEDDKYFLSTIQLKGYRPPIGIHPKDRTAALNILKLNGADDVLTTAVTIKFSPDFKTLRLTYRDPRDAQETCSILSRCAADIVRNGQTPGYTHSVLTPPRFREQRTALYLIARQKKESGEISRFNFLIRQNVLCVRMSKAGNRDVILPFSPQAQAETPMETDTTPDRCSVCLLGFEDGELGALRCGHLYHRMCIMTNLSKTVECPTCKQITPQITEEMIRCGKCILERNDPDNEPSRLILSRKCFHIHTSECQDNHLRTLPTAYPLTPASIPTLSASPHPGCHSCANAEHHPSMETSFIIPIQYFPGIKAYINPADSTAGAPSPAEMQLQPRPRPLFSAVLTGPNAAPIGDRRRMRSARPRPRPRSPPPTIPEVREGSS